MDIFAAVLSNDEKELKRLVEVDGISLQSVTTDEQTAAHLAAKTGNLPILKYLLERDSSLLFIRDRWSYTVLHLAARNGAFDVIKYLVEERNLDINDHAKNDYGNTILHIAAHVGQFELVKYLTEYQEFPVDIQNEVGETPLFQAAENKHLNIVKYLVEVHNANMTVMDNNEDNILFVSSKNNDVSVPKYLIDEQKVNYDFKWRDYLGDTILHRAAWFDSVDFLKYFVEEKKADIDHTDTYNRTPIYQAVVRSHMASIKFLAEHGANLEIADSRHNKPVDITKDSRIITYLTGMMSKRNRRSIPETHVFHLPQEFPLLPERRLIQNVIGVESTELERLDSRRSSLPGFSHIDSFLMIANMYFRFSSGSAKHGRFNHRVETSDNVALQVLSSENYTFQERT